MHPRRQQWRCRHCSASGRLCRVPCAPADVAITSPGTGAPSSFPARPRRRPNFAGTPSPAPVSPSASPEFLRQPLPPCPCVSRRCRPLPRHGDIALHLGHSTSPGSHSTSLPRHPCRSLFGHPFLLTRAPVDRTTSVTNIAAARSSSASPLLRPNPASVRRRRLSSFALVVAFVPPSSRSHLSFAFRQVSRCSPVVVFVHGSVSSSPAPATPCFRPRIAAEVIPSPFVSIVPVRLRRPFVVVVPTPRRLMVSLLRYPVLVLSVSSRARCAVIDSGTRVSVSAVVRVRGWRPCSVCVCVPAR